jgi:hypothetical protein
LAKFGCKPVIEIDLASASGNTGEDVRFVFCAAARHRRVYVRDQSLAQGSTLQTLLSEIVRQPLISVEVGNRGAVE